MNRPGAIWTFVNRLCCTNVSLELAICWFLGLLSGAIYGCHTDPAYLHMMRAAAFDRVSIVGLFLLLYFPLFLSAFAAYINKPHWIVVICFVKTFLFASCSFALYDVFHSATWLVRIMLQFSEVISLPFYYLYCLRNISTMRSHIQKDTLLFGAVNFLIGILDYCVISPFLVDIIKI